MSALDAPHRPADEQRRRSDLDHDIVAVVAMVAILALTALCLLGQRVLPL